MNTEDILLPGYTSEGASPVSDTTPFPISTSLSDILIPPVTERVPFGSPPSYGIASRPMQPVLYSFSTVSPTSMLLLPPLSSPDSRPRYHISVSTNCFTPSSYITTIRTGSSDSDELVGEFEMGLTSKLKPPTVCVRGQEALLHDVLVGSRRDVASIIWKGQNGHLFWDDNSTTKKCYCTKHCRPFEILAEFTVPNGLRRLGEPAECTQLRVYPEGQEHFDDILISVLVLERKRTTLVVKDEAMVTCSSIRNPTMRTVGTPSLSRDINAETDVGASRRRRWHDTTFSLFGGGGDYNAQLHSL